MTEFSEKIAKIDTIKGTLFGCAMQLSSVILTLTGEVFKRAVQISTTIIVELFCRISARFTFRNGEIVIIHVSLRHLEGFLCAHKYTVAQVVIVANICHVTAITMPHRDTAVNSCERERTWAS